MFERFTDRARRVVVLAQEEARLLDHNYIGTEHILLGLVREGEGVAAQALTSLRIDLGTVRRQVQDIIGQGGSSPSGHIPFTPRSKKVLELALREAIQLGHNYIGTEHILLGLIREGEGVASQVLTRLGADADRVRQQVVRLLSGAQPVSEGGLAATPTDELRASATSLTSRLGRELIDGLLYRRFTAGAHRVLLLTESEALRLGSTNAGIEHLLLGLVAEEDGVAARALGTLGIDLPRLRVLAEQLLGRRAIMFVPQPTFSPDLLDVVEQALHEAQAAGSVRVDTEHLLLAFVHHAEDRGGMAGQALSVLQTTPEAVRQAVADTAPTQDPGPAPPISSVLREINLDQQPYAPPPEPDQDDESNEDDKPDEGEAGATGP
jgi:ATP-dependent Clp protease ATP-binding subunit ClpA